jgi:hypothetical protein
MKKYFIAGKEVHSDKNLESGSLSNYYELGHECVCTHLYAKRLIKIGKLIPSKDVVVTCEGREFFYSNYIETITWKEYEEICKKEITNSLNPIDFFLNTIFQETPYFHELYMNNNQPKYKYGDEDYNIITNLDFNKELQIPNEQYICLNRRFRKHREELNMPEDYTKELILQLQKNFNKKIFITGYHNEFASTIDNVQWVSLRDWCTLINNDRCFAIVQNQTGTANLSQICGKIKLLNVILDMEMAHFFQIYANGRRPDVLGRAVNFKKLRNVIFKQLPPIQSIIQTIEKYAEV